jgi:hypothetical protein
MAEDYSQEMLFEIFGKTFVIYKEFEYLFESIVPRAVGTLSCVILKNPEIRETLFESFKTKDALGIISTKYLDEIYRSIPKNQETAQDKFVNSPSWILQPLIWINNDFKDKDGWTSLTLAGKKLKEMYYNSTELLQQIREKKGLYNFIKSHDIFEVKKVNRNCKYRVKEGPRDRVTE